jgi:hypothetical protein
MAQFSTVPVAEVTPKRKVKGPSQRSQTQQQYREALQHALDANQALVVELDPSDKVLTIRNRVRRAGQALDLDDLIIRRRGDRILAYRSVEAS